MIKLIVFDIDGVLTDGKIYIDKDGNEIKVLRLTEIDAVNTLHRSGYLIAALTGEATPITEYFKNRFPWDAFRTGCKDKASGLKELADAFGLPLSEICYIGDGQYDIGAVAIAGLGVCPNNAIEEVRQAAKVVLKTCGGEGCVDELRMVLNARQTMPSPCG
ncbi:MAG: HAD hydrolase family protein [Lachnospiraceae bacterium]|nr:HAD hydrolase family protein [Lachnospiraceae bacterium]